MICAIGYGRAHVSHFELALEETEHTIGRKEASDPRHSSHLERLVEQLPGRTVQRGAQYAKDFASQSFEIGQATFRLRDAGAAEKYNVTLVTGDQKLIRYGRAAGNEAHPSNLQPSASLIQWI